MHYIITGAGQIGSQLAKDLLSAGHGVTVIRRGDGVTPGAELLRGDAADRELLRKAVRSTTKAVFHCIHAGYNSKVWEAELPHREQAVMDVAADAGIPVIFPESVYAFGTAARSLDDDVVGASPTPVSPLGTVRAQLLAARRTHTARTLSIVAADLVGPTADPTSAVFHLLVFGPAARGRTAWVLGDPDVPRSLTYIPDLTAAMVIAADYAAELAPEGDAVLVSPSTGPLTQREMADTVSAVSASTQVSVRHIPWPVVTVAGWISPMMRELRRQRYLWDAPAVIRPGVLARQYPVPGQSDAMGTPWTSIRDELCSQ